MKTRIVLQQIAAAYLTVALVSCSKSNKSVTPADKSNVIELTASTKFGNVITDGNGKTLYFFSIDADGNSGCTAGCTDAWPTYYAANPQIGTGLNSADFGTITRTDGKMQTTYKGWPLYYYADDKVAGDINGDAVDSVWFVAKADYSVMLSNKQLLGNDGKDYTSNYQVGTGVTQYITDAAGNTLYSFSHDKANTNTFTKSDFSNNSVWPIDTTVSTVQSIPSILKKSDFGIIQVFGKSQLTYKGWPLYYFGADKATRGNNGGISFPTPGIWPITNSATVAAQ